MVTTRRRRCRQRSWTRLGTCPRLCRGGRAHTHTRVLRVAGAHCCWPVLPRTPRPPLPLPYLSLGSRTNLLRQSGLDFSKWTLSRFTSHSDIYDVLFKDAIQQTHRYTTSDRTSHRSFLFARTGVAGALQEMQVPSSRSTRRRTPSKRSYARGSRG